MEELLQTIKMYLDSVTIKDMENHVDSITPEYWDN